MFYILDEGTFLFDKGGATEKFALIARDAFNCALLWKKALKGYERGEEPITCRPAEVLEPELDKAKEETKDLAVDLDDVLVYALYPVTGKRFLKWKYGKEIPPQEVRPRTLEDVKAEQELIKKAKAGELIEKYTKEAPPKGGNLRTFNVFVDDEYFEVGVEPVDGAPAVDHIRPLQTPAAFAPASPQPKPAEPNAAGTIAAPAVKAPASPAAGMDGTSLIAPMPGMIVSFKKRVGDSVSQGESVVILEAMKMENALPAPVAGTVKAVNFSSGDSVIKGDVLCVIG